jgi:hypothetical protein
MRFVNWTFRVPQANRFVVTGYAAKAGEIRNQPDVIEQARQLGRNMVAH